MTYCLDKNSAVSGNESKLVKFLNKCMPCIVRPIIMKWSITQVLTVTEQLEAGVRYLDFRVAHKAGDPSMNLYFVHMVYTTVTVQVVPTLRTMWQRGYQVIVSYEEDLEMLKHCELWPAIPYWWGNKTTTHALIQFLELMKRMGRPETFFVAGFNLTENLSYILVHPFGSLKTMTLRSLPCLKIWVRKQYPGPQKEGINIIAGDFIGNDDFVRDVIELNTKINPQLDCPSKGSGTKSISFPAF
ncbi:UNVERIFIED_CONTAM: hypothetical protein H355_003459 [Colinus virginianus]|nr:hypothetical protein H355_003459 [Colinus virginianus]